LIERRELPKCPVCQARFRESSTCSRCGADLVPLMTLIVRSYRLRLLARRALQAGDFERARKLAREAQALCSTRKGEDLRLLSSWLLLARSFEPTPEIVTGERLGDLASRIYDTIAHRAYELFEARGYQHGHDMEDWSRAESELLHPLKINRWESVQEVVITAEIPGFAAQEVEIGVKPEQVTIWGKPDPKPGPTDAYPRRAPLALYHTLDLPSKIDPSKASAKLADGLLKLQLPKVGH
jgi:HSP20 family molecular chaperone IbpA